MGNNNNNKNKRDANPPSEWQGYQYPTGNNPRLEVEGSSPSLRDSISTAEETAIKEIASLYMGKLGMSLFISQFTIELHIHFFIVFSLDNH